jgi:hypothetical protein
MPVPAATAANAFSQQVRGVRDRSPDHDCDQARYFYDSARQKCLQCVDASIEV